MTKRCRSTFIIACNEELNLRRCLESGADGEKNLFHRLVSITEQTLVDEALKLCNGNQVAAAELLSVHRTTLRNKLNK